MTAPDGEQLLKELANFPAKTFESHFSRTSRRLGLGPRLTREELTLLYRAAFLATLCNISFNGLGGCEGEISPDREGTRTGLEREFMAARDEFYACRGWQNLRASQQGPIQRVFFTVSVTEQNLAQ